MRDGPGRPVPRRLAGKLIRFDTPPATEPPPRVEADTLLELFRAWINQAPAERRSMPRHEAVQYQIWLGWWRAEREFVAMKARLSNISRGGALVFLNDPPPKGHSVWVGLGEYEPSDCIEATVLDVRSGRRRDCTVRLSFQAPCPHAFFEAAVCILTRPSGRREPGRK